MKSNLKFLSVATLLLIAIALVTFSPAVRAAAVSGEQVLLGLKFISSGAVASTTTGVLQVAQVSTASALKANTLAEAVAAPTAGSIYVRGLLVEKISGATATVTLSYGTGTDCATGTTVLLGPITVGGAVPPYLPLGILVPATKALCVTTDGAGTGVRALSN